MKIAPRQAAAKFKTAVEPTGGYVCAMRAAVAWRPQYCAGALPAAICECDALECGESWRVQGSRMWMAGLRCDLNVVLVAEPHGLLALYEELSQDNVTLRHPRGVSLYTVSIVRPGA
ncbi:hypothetical protein J1614_002647 [Plenodomus biglobosus]|nr:hypothetical protein J1614_002647 [Plenodomus biglobosus]